MKISIITVVLNNRETLEDTILSVKNQTYKNIEHIVVDGGSTDGSVEIIKKHEKYLSKWVSEPDFGIYDAMNRGIAMAMGDVVGFLGSDDIYFSDSTITKVYRAINDNNSDCCYGDIVYTSSDLERTVRYWKAGRVEDNSFRHGWMPPHTSFFVRKSIIMNAGGFRNDLGISADYELMLRLFLKNKISYSYIPDVLVKMRIGGKSNRGIKNLVRKSFEDYKAWKVNGLKIGPSIMLKKPLSKIGQFLAGRRMKW